MNTPKYDKCKTCGCTTTSGSCPSCDSAISTNNPPEGDYCRMTPEEEFSRYPKFTPGPWEYNAETSTIRSMPENYWIATMDSFEGMVDNKTNARLIAAAPEMFHALCKIDANAAESIEWIRRVARSAIQMAVNC